MSTHGICFDNGNSGKCGVECEQFIEGGCANWSGICANGCAACTSCELLDTCNCYMTNFAKNTTHKNNECQHEWVEYVGFVENYKYCKKCDKKKN